MRRVPRSAAAAYLLSCACSISCGLIRCWKKTSMIICSMISLELWRISCLCDKVVSPATRGSCARESDQSGVACSPMRALRVDFDFLSLFRLLTRKRLRAQAHTQRRARRAFRGAFNPMPGGRPARRAARPWAAAQDVFVCTLPGFIGPSGLAAIGGGKGESSADII